jgi:hypothetical protein
VILGFLHRRIGRDGALVRHRWRITNARHASRPRREHDGSGSQRTPIPL